MPVSAPQRGWDRPAIRLGRAIAAGVLAVAATVGVSGCQYATLRDYTPADGVNVAIGSVTVRNLVIVATDQGKGVLLGTLVSGANDQLTSVKGAALLPNGDPGSALQVTSLAPVAVGPNAPVLLNDKAIRVTSTDLRAGLTARVELTFATAGSVTVVAPVMDKNSPEYRDLNLPA